MLSQQLSVKAFNVDIGFHKNIALAFSGIGMLESVISLVMEIRHMIEMSQISEIGTMGHDLMQFGGLAYHTL